MLFADVSGFTTLSEQLDPEQVSEIVHQTFDIVLNVVHQYQGTVNQFLGDGAMALFGEVPGEHHACRALGAALDVRERLETVRREVWRTYGLEFRVRISVNTGPVVIGTIGASLRSDYTAMGATASVASGLLRVAHPGQIVLSGATRELAAGRYDCAALGTIRAAKSHDTVELYELIDETAYAETEA